MFAKYSIWEINNFAAAAAGMWNFQLLLMHLLCCLPGWQIMHYSSQATTINNNLLFRWMAALFLRKESASWVVKWLCRICGNLIMACTNVWCPTRSPPLLLEQLCWSNGQHRMHRQTWLSPAQKLLQWPSNGTLDTVDVRHANRPTKSGAQLVFQVT